MTQPHWVAWHGPYANPASRLSRRLAVVQAEIRAAVDRVPPGTVRLISMCAGQALDIVGALADHPRRDDVTGVAVEMEPANVVVAREALVSAAIHRIDVVEGDASTTDAYATSVPADIALICGVFGNISDKDILHTIESLRCLCAPGATAIWTRHRSPPDLTPQIRRWFDERAWEEVAFVAPVDTTFAVGANRFHGVVGAWKPGIRLFTFTGDGGGA